MPHREQNLSPASDGVAHPGHGGPRNAVPHREQKFASGDPAGCRHCGHCGHSARAVVVMEAALPARHFAAPGARPGLAHGLLESDMRSPIRFSRLRVTRPGLSSGSPTAHRSQSRRRVDKPTLDPEMAFEDGGERPHSPYFRSVVAPEKHRHTQLGRFDGMVMPGLAGDQDIDGGGGGLVQDGRPGAGDHAHAGDAAGPSRQGPDRPAGERRK